MSSKPNSLNLGSVQDIPQTGPWNTKSGGELRVLFNFTKQQLEAFSNNGSSHVFAGLRSYRVTELAAQSIGANEWHKHRTELVFVTKGLIEWECIDSTNNKVTTKLSPSSNGLLIPPRTLHKYRALEDDCEILVITNTYFDPSDSTTHDTYSADSFITTQ